MLAVGGAGVTYIARELDADEAETGPQLALKILLAARDQGPYVRRLATEAQIIQELDHPNIVQYLGFVHRSGHSPYLITRFEAGGSLLDHMQRVGTLSVKQAAVVGRQICRALEKGHERGIVHRDLKPENVLLSKPVSASEDPVIRVADFGIAKVTGSLGSGITRVGTFVGTPNYAAPEQFVGGAVSEMADVYSVGALLFFCMTARHVISVADRLDPDDSFQLLCDSLPAVVRRDQDPAEDVRRVNQVLAVAMALDPQQRCSVMQLDAMLEAILSDQDPSIPTRSRAEPTDEIMAGSSSVTGVAAALEASGSPAPPPMVPTGPGTGSGPSLPVEAALEPLASPAAASAPGEPPPAEDGAPPRRRRGCMGCLMAVLGVLGTVCALGAAGVAMLRGPEPGPADMLAPAADGGPVVEAVGSEPTELAEGEPTEEARADYAAIQQSAAELREWLGGACRIPSGEQARVGVIIEPSGEVREAWAMGGGGTSACVAGKLYGQQLMRSGAEPVRVDLAWSW